MPALRGGLLGDLSPPLWGELACPLLSALGAALALGDGDGIVSRKRLLGGLSARLLEDLVGKLERVAGSLGVHRHLLTVTRGDPSQSRPADLHVFPAVPLYDPSRVWGRHSPQKRACKLRRQALALRRMVETGDDSSFWDVDKGVAPTPSHRAGRRTPVDAKRGRDHTP